MATVTETTMIEAIIIAIDNCYQAAARRGPVSDEWAPSDDDRAYIVRQIRMVHGRAPTAEEWAGAGYKNLGDRIGTSPAEVTKPGPRLSLTYRLTNVPPNLPPGEYRAACVAVDTGAGPQSCYPEDVATLREMLTEQRQQLESMSYRHATAAVTWARAQSERRIEALTTAIEALGGAL